MALVVVADSDLAEAGRSLNHADASVRAKAVTTVARSGDAGKQYFDEIFAIMGADSSKVVKASAAEALASIASGNESKAVTALEQSLSSEDATLRAAAARGLGVLKATTAVAKLGALLADSHMTVRDAALEALASCGEKSGPQADAVAANLAVPMLRLGAIQTLGRMGKEGAAHASELAGFLEDSDPDIRLAIAEAFQRMRAHVPDVVAEEVGELLAHKNDRFRSTAAIAVGALGPEKAAKYVGTLVRMLREHTVSNIAMLAPNCAAAIALGKMGVEGDQVAAYLVAKKPEMRASACQGLAELGQAAVPYTPRIAQCLEDQSEGVRTFALRALEQIKQAGGRLDDGIISAMEMAQLRR